MKEFVEAVKQGDEDTVRGRLAQDPELANAREGELPVVMLATYYGHRGVAQTLVDHGAQVDIFAAAALGKSDRAAILLKEDSGRVNAWSDDGWTPLALAAYFGQRETAGLLLASGADTAARSKNDNQNTALHAAIAGKRHELVELLVESGADIDARDGRGWTPINLAAHEGPAETVEWLLAHGADPTIPNNEGRAPLQTAEHEGQTDVVATLRRGLPAERAS